MALAEGAPPMPEFAPVTGWLRADVEAAKLQRDMELAMISMSGRVGRVRGSGFSDTTATDLAADSIGRGIARSYQEEQRLIAENSRMRAQLEVMASEGAVDAISETRELRRQIDALQARGEAEKLKNEEELLLAANKIHALTGALSSASGAVSRVTLERERE
ncbi:hypothetical protein T484DRAFT_1906529 [Baffinella frigidus]|nr:hypothetical protein T484DRAFT_1906529 [Cryptophyta sp. CCMP2293]